ncbi:MAG: hypothetical protein AAF674_22265 [Pseudomonadota bacterium]
MTDVFIFDLDGDNKPDLSVVMGPESKMGEVGGEAITFPDYIDYIGKGEDGPEGAWLAAIRPAITWDYNGESGKEGAETWANEADALIFLIG